MFLFRALASGSSGNAYLLRSGPTALLVDAGLPLSRLTKYLAQEDLRPGELTGVLISHEHRDHCTAARDLATRCHVPVWANCEVLAAAGVHDLPQARVLDIGRPVLIGDIEVTAFPVLHDAVSPVGFQLASPQRTITVATDLGDLTDEVVTAVRRADLVVLEANHDLELLQRSRYPAHLRARVAGRTGHLSNVQAARAIAAHARDDQAEVWLAHLSRENNTPRLALQTVRQALKMAGRTLGVEVVRRDTPSLRWTGAPRPRQLQLFAGWEASSA